LEFDLLRAAAGAGQNVQSNQPVLYSKRVSSNTRVLVPVYRTQTFVVLVGIVAETVRICPAGIDSRLRGSSLIATVISAGFEEGFSTTVFMIFLPDGIRAQKKPDPVSDSGFKSRRLELVLYP